MASTAPYLVRLQLKDGAVEPGEYLFNLPLIRRLDIEFASPVTFFVTLAKTGPARLLQIRG